MENDVNLSQASARFLEQIRPFVSSDDKYGQICSDLGDLIEAFNWLKSTLLNVVDEKLDPMDLETMIINIDVHFVRHSMRHLRSLQKEIPSILDGFPKDEE